MWKKKVIICKNLIWSYKNIIRPFTLCELHAFVFDQLTQPSYKWHTMYTCMYLTNQKNARKARWTPEQARMQAHQLSTPRWPVYVHEPLARAVCVIWLWAHTQFLLGVDPLIWCLVTAACVISVMAKWWCPPSSYMYIPLLVGLSWSCQEITLPPAVRRLCCFKGAAPGFNNAVAPRV